MKRFLNMTYQEWTWVLVGLELLAVEVYALIRHDPLLTDALRLGSTRWMIWPALFGGFVGHFYGERGGPVWGPWLLLGLALLVLARDLFIKTPVPAITHMSIVLIFMGLGAWLWGSR